MTRKKEAEWRHLCREVPSWVNYEKVIVYKGVGGRRWDRPCLYCGRTEDEEDRRSEQAD